MFRCYRQLEHSDCGLTCIRMVARHFGSRVPLARLRDMADFNRLGMSVKDIRQVLAELGLRSEMAKVPMSAVDRMPLPAILYWRQCHFVVLYKVDTRRSLYKVTDPADGKMCYSREEFAKYWIPEGQTAGLAVIAEPDEDFVPAKSRGGEFGAFWRYIYSHITNHRRSLAVALAVTLLIMCADLAVPLLLRRTVDEGIGLGDVGLVAALLASQLAISAGGLLASGVMTFTLTRTGLKVNLDMVGIFLSRLARFPLSFFDRKESSDFVQKINDESRIKDFLVSFPNTMVTTVLTLAVFSVLLLHYSPLIFGLFVVLSLLELGWNALFLSRRKSLDYAYFTHSAENRNHAYELTDGMADLKVNNAEDARIAKWKDTQARLNDVSMRSMWLGQFQGGGHTLISRIKELAITGISAWMVIEGNMTFGIMMTLSYITGRLSVPFNSLSDTVAGLQNAVMSYQRIEEIVNGATHHRGNHKFTAPTIELRNVWFKYAGSASPFVIQDFSLTVEPGKVTALVGESGCGKSTLIKLMLGFYIPQRGQVRLSGHDVAEADSADWLSHCGVVMQEAKIFSGSILENVALGGDGTDAAKVLELLDTVGLKDFVRGLPMGLSTKLGVSGIELSGGQKQRLMIARALYKNPDILFLDEATSSLDAHNERTVVDAVRAFGKGKTVVVAAHRLSTVMHADKIVFIKDGRIHEQGTHTQLAGLRGAYWALVKNQLQLSV